MVREIRSHEKIDVVEMELPNPKNWRNWGYSDYVKYFLSYRSAKRRLRGKGFPLDILSKREAERFCDPVRKRVKKKFSTSSPSVSITLAAYNEEIQILPTIISYTLLECEDNLAELIVVDNDSNDRTRELAKKCGAKVVKCEEKGLQYVRKKGLSSAYEDAEYIWISDSDVRVVSPFQDEKEIGRRGTALKTSYNHLESNPDVVGVSTGVVIESSHWLYGVTHNLALALGVANEYSCWSGGNQFMRKWALEESGGINVEAGGSSEDHIRHFQLARWAKKNDKHLHSANMYEALADPVYHSGRRVSSAKRVLESIWTSINRSNVEKGDHWSETKHTGEEWWVEMGEKQ